MASRNLNCDALDLTKTSCGKQNNSDLSLLTLPALTLSGGGLQDRTLSTTLCITFLPSSTAAWSLLSSDPRCCSLTVPGPLPSDPSLYSIVNWQLKTGFFAQQGGLGSVCSAECKYSGQEGRNRIINQRTSKNNPVLRTEKYCQSREL